MHPDWVFDDTDRAMMSVALAEAEEAARRHEIPVGAVVAHDGKIVARAGNRRQELADPCGHAEILALRSAGSALGDWRLSGCTLYVTLEPCAMCTAACRQSRLDLVVWGADDREGGTCGTTVDLAEDPRLGPPLAHRGGLYADASRELLHCFFAKQRGSS